MTLIETKFNNKKVLTGEVKNNNGLIHRTIILNKGMFLRSLIIQNLTS